jgi:hypothetical protein
LNARTGNLEARVIGFAAPSVTLWVATAVAAALIAGGALAIRRDGRPRRTARMAALGTGVVGILGLVAQPVRDDSHAARHTIILETPGPGARGASVRLHEGNDWRLVADAPTLWRNRPDIRSIEVRGEGLDAEDFRGYRGAINRFEPAPLMPGIVSAVWTRSLVVGAPWRVEARAVVPAGGRLELSGPGGVEVDTDATRAAHGVTLTALPRAPGRFLYSLTVRDAHGAEVGHEILDVTVETPPPTRALVLLGAPSFDAQALLRWLRTAKVPFEARFEVSRDRSHVETFWPEGGAPPPASPLGPAALGKFDVVLIDGRSLAALAARERTLLDAAVGQGLGLLVVDTEVADERGLGLNSRVIAGAAEREVHLRWPGQAPLPALTIPSREITPQPDVTDWVTDGNGHILVARHRRAQGFVALSLLNGAYRLALESPAGDYASLWAHLLSAVVRPRTGAWLVVPTGPVIVDRPVDLTVIAPGPRPPRLVAADAGEETELPVAAMRRGEFRSRLWPRHEGWLRLATDGGSSAWIYVSGNGRWQRYREASRIAATRERAALPAGSGARTGPQHLPGPQWPWYSLFLAGFGLLWLIERMGGDA